MNRKIIAAAGALLSAALLIGPTVAANAAAATGTTATTPPQPKMHPHNSNTLHKIGKAIQYTARKDSENLAVDTHKAVKSKSVVRNRKTGNNFVEKPSGHTVLKSSTNPYVRHHWTKYRHYHHYRHTMHKKMMHKKTTMKKKS